MSDACDIDRDLASAMNTGVIKSLEVNYNDDPVDLSATGTAGGQC